MLPSTGAAEPYRPSAPSSGYGVNTLLSTSDLVSVEDEKLFYTRLSDRTAASEQERVAAIMNGGTVLNDVGTREVSGPSESLLLSPNRTNVPTSSALPEAAYLLYDTSSPPIPERLTDNAAQDPVLMIDKLLSPLQVTGPKINSSGFDGEEAGATVLGIEIGTMIVAGEHKRDRRRKKRSSSRQRRI